MIRIEKEGGREGDKKKKKKNWLEEINEALH